MQTLINKTTCILISVLVLVLSLPLFAEIPQLMNFQGRLEDNAGNPLNGSHDLTFTIYDAAVGGTNLWSETQVNVLVKDGLFNVLLGSATPIDHAIFDGEYSFLGISIDGSPELAPRQRITSVAYANRVATIDAAAGGVIHGKVSVDSSFTVGAGHNADGVFNFVTGSSNSSNGAFASVTGGHNNYADGSSNHIGAGGNNSINGAWYAVISGGYGNMVTGHRGMIPGGHYNEAGGWASFAAGFGAKARHDNTFVWNDGSNNDSLETTAPHQFLVGASGGVGFNTAPIAPFHLQTDEIDLNATALEADRVVVEAADAVLGLYSTNSGVVGSGIALGEVDNGVLTNKWGLIRQTSSGGNALALTYGVNPSIYGNTPVLWMEDSGDVGIGTSVPNATLNVKGGRWNLNSGEGDFKIGNDSYRFKIGVATGGGGAGIVRMRSEGGANRLVLGSDSSDVLTVSGKSMALNSLDPTNPLTVYGTGTGSGAFLGDSDVVARFENTTPSSYTAISIDAPSSQGGSMIFAEDGEGKAGVWYHAFGRLIMGFDGWAEIRIDEADHNVGIGINPASDYKLHVAGDLRASDICYSGTIGACSDKRYKKNVTPLSGSLAKIASLRPVNYEWRRDEFPDHDFEDGNQVGLIAQEVLEVVPEVVSRDSEGYYSVDYGRLTPILVQAIKEQQTTIDDLRTQLAGALKRLEQVESKLVQ